MTSNYRQGYHVFYLLSFLSRCNSTGKWQIIACIRTCRPLSERLSGSMQQSNLVRHAHTHAVSQQSVSPRSALTSDAPMRSPILKP